MGFVVLSCGAVLAAVLVVSAAAKVVRPDTVREALTASGFPPWAVQVLVPVVPVVEAVIAVGLLALPTRRLAAVAAVLLLLAFSAYLLVHVSRGTGHSCACFGALGGSEVTHRTLLRNVVLLVLAVVAGGRSATWAEAVRAADGGVLTLLLLAAVVVLAAALAASVRLQLKLVGAYGDVLVAVDDLREQRPSGGHGSTPRHRAPDLVVTEQDGAPVQLSSLWAGAGRGALLVFSDPACETCRTLLPELERWASRLRGVQVAVVSPSDVRGRGRRTGDNDIGWLLDPGRAAFEAYRVRGTPSAVLVAPDGHVTEHVAGAPAVAVLVRSLAVAALSLAAVDVLDAGGEQVRLGQAVRDGSVLFWSATCQYCQQLLEPLEARGDDLPDAPVVVVARGRPGEVAVPSGWPVLYDPDVLAEQVAGSPGTPSLLTLADGDVIDVQVGVSAVLDRLDAALSPRGPLPTTGGRR